MRNFLKLLIVSVILVPVLFSQEKPADVRFSVDMLDKSIDPCNNFYAYACSKWMAQNPIPADRSGWGRFHELQQRGEYVVRDILEKASADKPGRSVNEQKIGDYYATCMDESAIEKAGTKPLDRDFIALRRSRPRPTFRKKFCACIAKASMRCSASIPVPISRMPARSLPSSIRVDWACPTVSRRTAG